MSGEHTQKSVNTVTQINLHINAPSLNGLVGGKQDYPIYNTARDDDQELCSDRLPGNILSS